MIFTDSIVQALMLGAVGDCTISSYRKLPQKTGNVLWEIVTDRGIFLLKLYNPMDAWKAEKELQLFLLFREHGIPVPAFISAIQPTAMIDQPALLMSWSGVPLAQTTLQANAYDQLGHILKTIHSIPQKEFGYIEQGWSVGKFASNEEFMCTEFAGWIDRFISAGGDHALAVSVDLYVKKHSYLFRSCLQPSLCHHDFHAWNLLVDEEKNQVTAVLDMEWSLAGDPLIDLAQVHYTMLQDDPVKIETFYKGYGEVAHFDPDAMHLYLLLRLLQLWIWSLTGEHYHKSAVLLQDIKAILAGEFVLYKEKQFAAFM